MCILRISWNAGATGILVYNNRLLDPAVQSVPVPANSTAFHAFISNGDGQILLNEHNAGENVTIKLSNLLVSSASDLVLTKSLYER